jgi:hypothetical protein
MIGTPAKPNDPKVGRVLGGGKVKKSHPYTLVVKDNRKSVRTAKMLETVVNARFHQSEDGRQKGVATAKTDSYLELKVPATYHQNQQHFFRVLQLLPMIDAPELRVRRTSAWSKELLDPTTAGVAAMKLEGLGSPAIESLQAGLKSPNAQVRFFSGQSLAYLDDPSGVEALGEVAAHQPEFRVYALAALAAMDHAASHLKLRKLMDEPDVEVRYGAFNALRTLDPHDPFLGLLRVIDEPKREDEDDESPDAMALAFASATRHRPGQDDPFALYVVDSEGPPLVHVSRTRRPEIVIFGRQQKLLAPIVLGTGPILLNASENDDKVEVSKIIPSRFGDADAKVTTTLELAEVLRRAANLGASYPEIVSILESASRQRNLPGPLVVDAVPSSNPAYLEAILGKDATAKRDDALKRTAGETSRSRRRWLFGILGRESARNTKNHPEESTNQNAINKPAQGKDAGAASDAPRPSTVSDPGAPNNVKNGDTAASEPDAKKDDAVQKAGTETPVPRKRFFDFWRKNDEP